MSKKKHLFAYISPKPSKEKSMEIKSYLENDTINFERIRLQVKEVRDIIQNLEVNLQDRKVKITYPDSQTYLFDTEQHPFDEPLKVKERYGNICMYMPCYRLQIKSEVFIFQDKEFKTISKIDYPNTVVAAKDIFNHKDMMFTQDRYNQGVMYPLIIDLAHFEWYIKKFQYLRNIVEIEIDEMVKNNEVKPFGVLNVEFTNGDYKTRRVEFESNNLKETFEHNIANVKFHLQTYIEKGFDGDFNNPKPGGKVLDYRHSLRYSTKHEDHIKLDSISPSELKRFIDEKENEILKFK